MKKILLTGGSGFIGSHLTKFLIENGYYVRVFDLKENKVLKHYSNYEFYQGDITSKTSIDEAFESIDYVIHLAAIVSSSKQELYFKINSEGTKKLAEAAKTNRVKRFVFISSMSAAGPSKEGLDETALENPANFYGKSKLQAEHYLREVGDLEFVILRPSAVYGPFAYDSIPLFKLMNISIDIRFVSYAPKFQMVHVSDFVLAVKTALESENVVGKTYFIANPEILDDRKISEIAKMSFNKPYMVPIYISKKVLRLLGYGGSLLSLLPKVNIFLTRDKVKDLLGEWVYSTKRFSEDTGFVYSIGYKEGIKQTVEWFLEQEKEAKRKKKWF